MKNVVVIGGGTGLSAMMAGLKDLEDVSLTAVITVADDGGSTGRIRDVYNIPAMGDIRHVLCAMGEKQSNPIFSELMNYRFSGSEDIGGHQLGNLIFLALVNITGSFMGAVQAISDVLNVKGTILPSTLDNCRLYAVTQDGQFIEGEKNIPDPDRTISRVLYQTPVTPYFKAVEAIQKADLLIFGTGSLYTSIMPNVIIDGIRLAIENNACPKVYFCNAMTQPGETDHYSLEDHVRALEKHLSAGIIDTVVANNYPLSKATAAKYAAMNSEPVLLKESSHSYDIIEENMIMLDEIGRIRHDPKAVARVVGEMLDKMDQDQKAESQPA